ncbi:MAG: hypothetical protein R3B09_10475 [Nannocystaceae bacterium]
MTNVNEDGSIPKTSQWKQNFKDPNLNTFRQNAQGAADAEFLPDITSEFTKPACDFEGGKSTLSAEVCNRGLKTAGDGLSVSFYGGDPEVLLCVAVTDQPLTAGECVIVSCEVDGEVMGKVHVEGNDDGMGGKSTVECIETNNGDVVDPVVCQ